MQLTGRSKHAQKLLMGVKSHAVQNSLPLAASMVCCVDNVVQLQQSIVPSERELWPIVWASGQKTALPWRTYIFTFLSAVRQLLLRMRGPENTSAVSHPGVFALIAPCSSELMRSILVGSGKVSINTAGNADSSSSGGSSSTADLTVVDESGLCSCGT
jgi:hypothetical protein